MRNSKLSIILNVIIISFVVSIWGCSAKRTYPGPRLPSNQIAILECGEDVAFFTLDGRSPSHETSFNKDEYEILPGKHTIGVRFFHTVGAGRYRTSQFDSNDTLLQLDAIAGAHYIVKFFGGLLPGRFVIERVR
jgi:hypothetical protein